MTKKLFVVISNGGNGSYYPQYTFNEEWIKRLENAERHFDMESGWSEDKDYNEDYCDGDGFHYDTLNVPDECTLESLGVRDAAKE